MENKLLKMRKWMVICAILLVLTLMISGTYSLWNYFKVGENQQLVAGDIYLKYTQNTDNLNITNAMPSDTYNETDKLEFTIEGKNTYKKDVWYEIVIDHGEDSEERHTRLDDKYLRFRLTETKGESTEEVVVEEGSYEDFSTGKSIWVNTIAAGTKDQINIKYKLYVWISNEVQIGNTEETIPMEQWNDTFASIKVTVNGDFDEKLVDGNGIDSMLKLSEGNGVISVNDTKKIVATAMAIGTFSVKSEIPTIAEAVVEQTQGTETNIIIKGKMEGKTKIKVTYKPIDKSYKSEVLTYEVMVSNNIATNKIKGTIGKTGGVIGVLENNTKVVYNDNNIREYRYSGLNVNNFVYFNCKDDMEQNSSNCEKWRIIGVFKDENNEEHLKIVRDEILKANDMPENYEVNGKTYKIKSNSTSIYAYWNYDGSQYRSDWSISGLMYWLNSKGTDKENIGYLKKLSSSSQSMIEETKYYLGNNIYGTDGDDTASAYVNERTLSNIYDMNKALWSGKVALMYPSDFGFTADSSYWTGTKLYNYSTAATTSWLKEIHTSDEWFLSPSSNSSYQNIATWSSSGYIYSYAANNSYCVRPTVNLKNSIVIVAGDGTSDKPYQLEVKKTELFLSKNFDYVENGKSNTFKAATNMYGTFEIKSQSPNIATISVDKKNGNEINVTVYGLKNGIAKINVIFTPNNSNFNSTIASYYIKVVDNVVSAMSIKSTLGINGGIIGITENNKKTIIDREDIREYRYSGLEVNNYIYFNCKDDMEQNSSNCEKWRIIGIFKDENGEEKIKITRNEYLRSVFPSTYTVNKKVYKISTEFDYNYSASWNRYNKEDCDNNWTNGGLKYWLNSEGDTGGGYLNSLNSTYQKMIAETKYYLGNLTYSYPGIEETTSEAYLNERKSNICSSVESNGCLGGSIWPNNSGTWNGKIGLMYASDYGYSADSQYWTSVKLYDYSKGAGETSWLQKNQNHGRYTDEWLISPSSVNTGSITSWEENRISVRYARGQATASGSYTGYTGASVRPVLYLKPEVIITEGNGTEIEPYQLKFSE